MKGPPRFFEKLCFAAGTVLLGLTAIVWIDGAAHSQSAIDDFERIGQRVVTPAEQASWSPQRKTDYRHALAREAGDTLAVLRIPAHDIEVAVFDSVGEVALNRGSGHVDGTALPGEDGNIAIAGHRDGFFRGLKDITLGDEIELTSLAGVQNFRVSGIDIVDPLNVSVLDPTDDTVITLITCFPFYYLGAAPDRFIVRATLVKEKETINETT